MFHYSNLILSIALAVLPGCVDHSFNGKLSTPTEAQVSVSTTLSHFDADTSDLLFRYLSGNSRWEIREERGKRYAVRRELVDGELETTLNGFYSTYNDDAEVRQTRVLISFGQQYGFGVEHGNVTRISNTTPRSRFTRVIGIRSTRLALSFGMSRKRVRPGWANTQD